MKKVVIHTDGACEGNPGPGGWPAVLEHGTARKELSGGDPATTNNRMELQAAISALLALKQPCEVDFYTDSEYLREGITNWVPGWKAKGWMLSQKKAVKNDDLWRQLDQLAGQHRMHWHWLKGHAGHPENERCDALACAEITKIRKQYTPEELRKLLAEFQENRSPTRNQANLLTVDGVFRAG